MLYMVAWSVRVLRRSQKLAATLAQSIVNGLSGPNMENAPKSAGMVSRSGIVVKQPGQPMAGNPAKEILRRRRIVIKESALSLVTSLTG
jgi:hypothetical protein